MPKRAGTRTLGVCPYRDCGAGNLVPAADGAITRNPNHKLVRCAGCLGYAIRTPSGMVFPLTDASDPNAEAATSVPE